MNETRKKIYDEWREKYQYEDPAKAVGWRNQEALDARFKCTLNHLYHKDLKGLRILDVGCGSSLNLLRYINLSDVQYVGIDCNEESLKYASEKWKIPYSNFYDSKLDAQLIMDEYLIKLDNCKFDVILAQGIYQEFDSIKDIMSHANKLCTLLTPGGEFLAMTPANRVLDAEGKSVLKISPYDAVTILENTGLPYELSLGELGEHIIMKVRRI